MLEFEVQMIFAKAGFEPVHELLADDFVLNAQVVGQVGLLDEFKTGAIDGVLS